MNTLLELRKIIESRRGADPETSYVAKLFSKGINKISQKVGEEAVETIVAALGQSRKRTISESADLLFHLSLLWAEREITVEEVMQELDSRMGESGLDAKAAKKAKSN